MAMIYKCINKDCILYNKDKQETAHSIYPPGGRVDNKLRCTECGKDREVVASDNGYCRTIIGRPNVPTS